MAARTVTAIGRAVHPDLRRHKARPDGRGRGVRCRDGGGRAARASPEQSANAFGIGGSSSAGLFRLRRRPRRHQRCTPASLARRAQAALLAELESKVRRNMIGARDGSMQAFASTGDVHVRSNCACGSSASRTITSSRNRAAATSSCGRGAYPDPRRQKIATRKWSTSRWRPTTVAANAGAGWDDYASAQFSSDPDGLRWPGIPRRRGRPITRTRPQRSGLGGAGGEVRGLRAA